MRYACRSVVEYSLKDQARMAQDMAGLPEGAVVVDWMADYAALREQSGACRQADNPELSF